MMKRLLSKALTITLLLLLGSNSAFAQRLERIILQNGSSYEGYISKQIVGKSFTFTTADHESKTFKYEDVKEIDKAQQQGNYIIDKIFYKDSSNETIILEGQIIKNILGECLILLDNLGSTHRIPIEKIIKQERFPNADRNYFQDSPFIETVYDSELDPHEGFIFMQSYTNNILFVKDFSDSVISIGLSDIQMIKKKVNRECPYTEFPVNIEETTSSEEVPLKSVPSDESVVEGEDKAYVFDKEGTFSQVKKTNDSFCYIDTCISVIKISKERINDSLIVTVDNSDQGNISLLNVAHSEDGAYLFRLGNGKAGEGEMQGSKLAIKYDVRRGTYALYRKKNNTAVIISIK